MLAKVRAWSGIRLAIDEVDEVDTLIPIDESENENKIVNRKAASTSPTSSSKNILNTSCVTRLLVAKVTNVTLFYHTWKMKRIK